MNLPIAELIAKRSEQRKFGLVMAGGFIVIGSIRWLWRGETSGVLFGVALAFGLLAVLVPIALKPVFFLWLKLAEVLNWVMTRVFLTIAFYLIITPVALVYRIVAGDPLKRTWDASTESYWEEPDAQPTDRDEYKMQF